jgi:hypothetical protein
LGHGEDHHGTHGRQQTKKQQAFSTNKPQKGLGHRALTSSGGWPQSLVRVDFIGRWIHIQ